MLSWIFFILNKYYLFHTKKNLGHIGLCLTIEDYNSLSSALPMMTQSLYLLIHSLHSVGNHCNYVGIMFGLAYISFPKTT
jgi:hypothetical protein